MTTLSTFFIQGQPVSWNAAYEHVKPRARRDGKKARRRALSDEAIAWKEVVGYMVKAKVAECGWPKLTPPLLIHYRFQGVKGDVDNYLKLVGDSIAGALGINDRYFRIGSAWTQEGRPGVWLTIEEVSEEAA